MILGRPFLIYSSRDKTGIHERTVLHPIMYWGHKTHAAEQQLNMEKKKSSDENLNDCVRRTYVKLGAHFITYVCVSSKRSFFT